MVPCRARICSARKAGSFSSAVGSVWPAAFAVPLTAFRVLEACCFRPALFMTTLRGGCDELELAELDIELGCFLGESLDAMLDFLLRHLLVLREDLLAD